MAAADLIQSVDSVEIMRVDKQTRAGGKVQDVLLEFNISEKQASTACRRKVWTKLQQKAGVVTRPEISAGLAEMWEVLKTYFPKGRVSVLSVGMTRDFKRQTERALRWYASAPPFLASGIMQMGKEKQNELTGCI